MLSKTTRSGLPVLVAALMTVLVAAMLTVGASSANAATTGTVYGTVQSDAKGYRSDQIRVTAYRDGDNGWGAEYGTSLNGAGGFSFSNMIPGTYRIKFSDNSEITSDQFWMYQSTFEAAKDIEVTAGSQAQIRANLPARPKLVYTNQPELSGTATPGSLLTVTAGDWTPQPSSVTYDWFLDGELVEGSYNRTGFRPTLGQLGQLIQVRVRVTAGGHAPTTAWSQGMVVVPSKPSNLHVQTTTAKANISWDMSPGATHFRVRVYQGQKLIDESSIVRATQLTRIKLLPDTVYRATVEGFFDSSFPSEPVTTTFRTKKLGVATKVKAYRRTADSIQIAWPAVEGARRYQVTYQAPRKPAKSRKTSARGLTLTKLKAGTKYTVRVTTFAFNGTKTVSKKFTFTTRKAKR